MHVGILKAAYVQLLLLIILFCSSSFAGWSDDFQLTHRGYEIEPQVIVRNDTVHVAWQEVAGQQQISYIRSLDGGQSWGNIWNFVEVGHRGLGSSLSLNADRILIGWSDVDVNGPNPVANIAFTISPGGENWSIPSYVFPFGFEGSEAQFFAISGDSVLLTFIPINSDSTNNQMIVFKYSPDLGATWSDSQIIGRTPEYLNGLRMKKCGANIYIIWSSVGINAFDVFVALSHDGGITWDEPRQLSSDIFDAQQPCIACDESNGPVAIGWVDSQESHSFPGDLYLKITSDGGISWGEELHATHHHKVASPNLTFAGDSLWAVWSDEDIAHWGPLNYEICFTKSTDLGASWIPYERLTYAQGFGYTPWISHGNGKLHVVWEECLRPPDSVASNIYYKRFEQDVRIENGEDNNLPNRLSLSAYPNPFNSSVVLSYFNLKGGKIGIYDILGKSIRNYEIKGGNNGKINWDATDASGEKVSSGIYFARAASQNNSSVIKLIYMK
jgi:hypothetical protein